MSNNKTDLNILKVFVEVAKNESFTKAALALRQPKSRVSRSISRLERDLDVQLLKRTTRKTSLTDSGHHLYQRLTPILSNLDRELNAITKRHREMSGLITLTAPQDIGQTLVADMISAFNEVYPRVHFKTLITNDYLDFMRENIDIAFRAGELKDSDLIQRKFISTSFIIVCSPQYLERFTKPTKLADLSDHKFLSFKYFEKRLFREPVELQPTVVSDSIPMLIHMALNGDGMAMLPDYFCEQPIKEKKLVHVLPNWKSQAEHIHLLYNSDKNKPQRVRVFIDFIKEFMKEYAK